MTELPLIGGFNDGKFIEPKGRTEIKMAKPPHYEGSVSHYETTIGFEFEIYSLTTIYMDNVAFRVYSIEGMTLPQIVEKLIFGYKQYNKRKTLDLKSE